MNQTLTLSDLSADGFDSFSKKYGKTINSDLISWIHLIASKEASGSNFERLNTLAWYIFVERSGRSFGEPKRFELEKKTEQFQEFIYTFNVFKVMKIPYSEWDIVVRSLFSALKEMAEQNELNFASEKCIEAQTTASETLKRLTKNEELNSRFSDFLNGAL